MSSGRDSSDNQDFGTPSSQGQGESQRNSNRNMNGDKLVGIDNM